MGSWTQAVSFELPTEQRRQEGNYNVLCCVLRPFKGYPVPNLRYEQIRPYYRLQLRSVSKSIRQIWSRDTAYIGLCLSNLCVQYIQCITNEYSSYYRRQLLYFYLLLPSTTQVSEMEAALYLRVSTSDQTTDNQQLELQKVADKMGWTVTEVFTDVISGAKAKRVGLDALMKAVTRKEVDMVMCFDVSRLGRSLSHLVTLLEEFQAKGVDLYFHRQALDTSTPSGKAMFQMLGVFAEFERGMIQERVKAGLRRAKAQGKRLGRPPVPPIQVEKIKALRQEGLSYRKIAKRMGLSVFTCHKLAT